MIRAGTESEISPASGEWLILDIGFANKAASCGLLINGYPPVELRFGEAVERVCEFVRASKRPVNFMIEAPLSVAFNKNGNPTGRYIEKKESTNRYWYVGPGCTVMVASLYLFKAITEIEDAAEVRLFEGFVSFKKRGSKSDHSRDVELLMKVVKNYPGPSSAIYDADTLRINSTDTLRSAFWVAGIDTGVPPVITAKG